MWQRVEGVLLITGLFAGGDLICCCQALLFASLPWMPEDMSGGEAPPHCNIALFLGRRGGGSGGARGIAGCGIAGVPVNGLSASSTEAEQAESVGAPASILQPVAADIDARRYLRMESDMQW